MSRYPFESIPHIREELDTAQETIKKLNRTVIERNREIERLETRIKSLEDELHRARVLGFTGRK